jgi:hypothetical protein
MAEGRSAGGAGLLARVGREIDERLARLRPAFDEYQQLLGAFDALELPAANSGQPAPAPATAAAASAPAKPRTPAKRRVSARSRREQPLGTAGLAILAALEHGSHTVAELGVVTAMSGPELRESARGLLRAGRIVKASREGRAAYALLGKE